MKLNKSVSSVSVDDIIVQEEALSALTGLPSQVLQQDQSTSMEWEDIIIPRLVERSLSIVDVTSIREQLLHVGFSGEFIDSTALNELYHESFSIEDVMYFFIRYAVAVILKTVPKVDANGFPAQLQCSTTPLNLWTNTQHLSVPLFLRTDNITNSARLIVSELSRSNNLNSSDPLYFHGTDWASAFEIIREGIDIDRCSGTPTDFGLKCFYVGDNFSLSLDWARIRYVKYVAVLCYSVSNSQFLERESKIFESADLEWKTAVYNFRRTGKHYRNKMRHYHLMKGPINAVRTDLVINTESIQPLSDKNGRIGYQIAVRTPDAASSMNLKLVGVVFYPSINKQTP